MRIKHLIQPNACKGRHRKVFFASLKDFGFGITQSPPYRDLRLLHRLVGHVQADGFLKLKMLPVHVGFGAHHALFLTGKEDGGEKASGIIMQRLQPARIVHAGPGHHRPAIVELPVNSAHTAAPVAAEMLHAVTDGICLEKL